MSKSSVSVIGCGGIAQVHLSALAKCADKAELSWVVDVRPEAAAEAAAKFGAKNHGTDWRSALGADTDAVILAVPTHRHAEIAVAVLDAGKDLFCEKPLARTLEDAASIRDAAAKSKARTAVGFVRRFDAEWLAFREAIQAGAIGSPVFWNDLASWHGPAAAWFGRDEEGGGPFLDGAIHNFDFALHTFGPAKSVYANGGTFKQENTAVDTGSAIVEFQSGDRLLVAWSWGLPQGCAGSRVFEFLGPQGTITWPDGMGAPPLPGAAETEIEMRRFVVDHAGRREDIPYPANALDAAYDLQINEFVSGCPPRAGAVDGYESLRLSLAVIESARTGKVVTLG